MNSVDPLVEGTNEFGDVSYTDVEDLQYVMFFPNMQNRFVEVGDGEGRTVVLEPDFAIAMAKEIFKHYGINYGVTL